MVNYYEYIRSKEWFERTAPVRKRNEGLCEVCNLRYGEDVHHRTYDRLGNEDLDDLLHVCRTCHAMIHRKDQGVIWKSRLPFLRELIDELPVPEEYFE